MKFINQQREYIQSEQCVQTRLLYELRQFITEGKMLVAFSRVSRTVASRVRVTGVLSDTR
jgi:hypothetical protein